MSFSVNTNRRKALTYGKALRKPISSFGDSLLKDTQNVRPDLKDWKECATSKLAISDNESKKSTGHVSVPRTVKIVNPDRTRRGSRMDCMNDDTSSASTNAQHLEDRQLFDVPSSYDDHGQAIEDVNLPSRKKRRISFESTDKNCEIVYDDFSLQRHVAAESGNDLDQSFPPICGVNLTQASSLQGFRKEKDVEPDKESQERAMPKIVIKRRARQHRTQSGKWASSKVDAGPGIQSHTLKITGALVSASQHTSEPGSAQSDLPNTLSRMTATARNDMLASDGEAHPIITPPRPVWNKRLQNTPLKHELRNKLQAKDTSNKSPGSIDLLNLVLTNRKDTKARKSFTKDKTMPIKVEQDTLRSGRGRLIDKLESLDDRIQKRYTFADGDLQCGTIVDSSESLRTEGSDWSDTYTIQTSPSTDSRTKPKSLEVRKTFGVSRPELNSAVVESKITYARQRSYLTDIDLDEVVVTEVSAATEYVKPQAFRLRAPGQGPSNAHQKKNSEAVCWDSQVSQSRTMRSIHELREAGGNNRLISELDAMLDDIEEGQTPSSKVRQASLLGLIVKLQDPSVSRLFVDHGLEVRLLALVGCDTEILTNALLATIILQLTACPSASAFISQLQNDRIIGFLIDLLSFDQDLAAEAKVRDVNLPKHVRHMFTSMCNSVLKSPVWRASSPSTLSCRVLALQCLEHIVWQTRETASCSMILSPYAIRHIVATSIPPSETKARDHATSSVVQLELAISILESCTSSEAAESLKPLWEGETLERIIGLLPLLCSWQEDKYRASRNLTLRLYVNLTNNNAGLCERFSRRDIVEIMCKTITTHFRRLPSHVNKDQRSMELDDLILMLGALVNLAESSDAVRQLVMNLHYGNRSHLAVLLELFSCHHQSTAEVYSEAELSLNVAFGYLSVLLGSLCLNDQVRARVANWLWEGSLKQLIHALEEFLQYYRKANHGLSQDAKDSVLGYTDRLEGLVEKLKS